jgi:hypothetical protein
LSTEISTIYIRLRSIAVPLDSWDIAVSLANLHAVMMDYPLGRRKRRNRL